ncbi:MAG: hypothetical protein AABX29_01410 [Nanoarchaeota archaeon]
MFNITSLINLSEATATKILNWLLSFETPVNSFFDSFWGRLPDWGFIVISTIIGAVVALKLERRFENKQKLYGWKLIKEAFNETAGITGALFIYGLFIGAGIIITLSLIKKGMEYSSSVTLIIFIFLLLWHLYSKKKKNKKLVSRFKKK